MSKCFPLFAAMEPATQAATTASTETRANKKPQRNMNPRRNRSRVPCPRSLDFDLCWGGSRPSTLPPRLYESCVLEWFPKVLCLLRYFKLSSSLSCAIGTLPGRPSTSRLIAQLDYDPA